MSSNEMFALQNVGKRFGKMDALSSLSFRIKKGEIVALIGPSGAGKTTCLDIMAGMAQADSGRCEIDGKASQQYKSGKELARKVGIIRQQFDLVGSLPVIHNVLAGRLGEWGFFKSLLSYLVPQEKDVALRALERVGLSDKLYERTSRLSGGEQQRVAIARMLVQRPEGILADEPVSSLDPARAEDVLHMLVRLVKEEGLTLVASLHSVGLAKTYFSRIIALKEGRLFFDKPAAAVSEADLSELYQFTELKEHADVFGTP